MFLNGCDEAGLSRFEGEVNAAAGHGVAETPAEGVDAAPIILDRAPHLDDGCQSTLRLALDGAYRALTGRHKTTDWPCGERRRIEGAPTRDNQTLRRRFWAPEPSHGAPIRCNVDVEDRDPAPYVGDEATHALLPQTTGDRTAPTRAKEGRYESRLVAKTALLFAAWKRSMTYAWYGQVDMLRTAPVVVAIVAR